MPCCGQARGGTIAAPRTLNEPNTAGQTRAQIEARMPRRPVPRAVQNNRTFTAAQPALQEA